MRRAIDGSLIAPRRGQPPECPPGYTRDPKDGYRFIKDVKTCTYRKNEIRSSSCCGAKTITVCSLLGRKITFVDCMRCKIKDSI